MEEKEDFVPQMPEGAPILRMVPQASDLNQFGIIFGGYLMSQMDMAGAVCAIERVCGKVFTVAVKELVFHEPGLCGDVVNMYADIARVGRTSITVRVQAWSQRLRDGKVQKAFLADGTFVYVSVGADGRPVDIGPAAAQR